LIFDATQKGTENGSLFPFSFIPSVPSEYGIRYSSAYSADECYRKGDRFRSNAPFIRIH